MAKNGEYDGLDSDTMRSCKENPTRNAGIFSVLFYRWVGEMVAIGNKRPIEDDDLFPLLDEDKTETSAEKLKRTWSEENEKRDSMTDRKGYRLFRALIRMFHWSYPLFVVSTALLAGVCNVLQCVFLSFLLTQFVKSSSSDRWLTYIYAAGICLSSLVRVIATQQWKFHAYLIALRWKSGTVAIIYEKVSEVLYSGPLSIYLSSYLSTQGFRATVTVRATVTGRSDCAYHVHFLVLFYLLSLLTYI